MSNEGECKRWHVGCGWPIFLACWFVGWLLTVGFAHLVWWKIILGIAVWPYYLGSALSSAGLQVSVSFFR
jgi:hypothetical protein